MDCWAIGGRIDYLMRVSSPSMAADLPRVISSV
nr:hypothetical protein [Mesorhizobium sp.]